MSHKIPTVLAVLLLLTMPARAEEEALPAFIDRIVEAYGGAEALSDPAAVRQTGHTVSKMRDGATGALRRVFQGSDRLRVEIAYPGEPPEVRALDGDRGWTKGGPATASMTAAMQLQAARMALPHILLERKSEVTNRGLTKGHGGTDLRILELALGPQLVILVGADTATGRIHFSSGEMRFGQGQSMKFSTLYSEFKSWDGRLFAGREAHYTMGSSTGYSVIETVETVDSLDPATFRP